MTKWRGVNSELEVLEDALQSAGAALSHRWHNEVKRLIKKLSRFKGVKLERLTMGMGSWSLDGELPATEFFQGEWQEPSQISFDGRNFGIVDIGRSVWDEGIERLNPGILDTMNQLEEILDQLTQNPYLSLIEIDPERMKILTN